MLVHSFHILSAFGACFAYAFPYPAVTERHDEFAGEVGVVELKYILACFG
jgi:hypothetical protein